jgi:hypothetical protein
MRAAVCDKYILEQDEEMHRIGGRRDSRAF